MTNIYFLVAEELNMVKIGRSQNVDKRLKAIQSTCPVLLKLGAVIENVDSIQESLIHQKFQKDRERGEWFRYTDEIKAYIKDPFYIAAKMATSKVDFSALDNTKIYVNIFDDTQDAWKAASDMCKELRKETKTRPGVWLDHPERNYIAVHRVRFPAIILQASDDGTFVKVLLLPPELSNLAILPSWVLVNWVENGDSYSSEASDEIRRRQQGEIDYPWSKRHRERYEQERMIIYRRMVMP